MEKGVWPQGAETHPALREAVNTTGTSISKHTPHTQHRHDFTQGELNEVLNT